MEQTRYNLLFRWFIGLSMDDAVWVPTVFTKNRERLIKHDAVIEFFNEVVAIAEKKDLLSGEHFSVDGTLIQAWAGHKSFVRKDGEDKDHDDGSGDFRGQQAQQPDARIQDRSRCGVTSQRQDQPASCSLRATQLSDNRHGLVVIRLSQLR